VAVKTSQRPANRPSRRDEIVTAAADLLATDSPELISVADIAGHAGLTSAAIYYHFRSRDELVDEIVRTFSAEWSTYLTSALADLASIDELPAFVDAHNDWIKQRSNTAMVYFVSSIGATSTGETIRRSTRHALTREAGIAIGRLTSSQDSVDLTVRALGLISLLEVASSDILRPSASYRTLGKAGFRRIMTDMMRTLIT
jgi:AcrR family transcriptional regulator